MAGDRMLVLTADTQDLAFGEIRRFGKGLQAAGLGRLRHHGSEGSGKVETFTWILDGGSSALELRLIDDEDLPAMFVELTGDEALLDQAVRIARGSFDVATPEQVVEAAEQEWMDDASLVSMAALAASPELEPRVLVLVQQLMADADVDRRTAGARAAALIASPGARLLVEQLAGKETQPRLSRQLNTLLERWGST